eukprot:CAMPEP_0174263284 /NCGR_PEP_ID=MMETSP0439-20130205/17970_1 /TAXON_ID=0 /ORGANISM="Stereomyxa ramosa, Strain Chinc5" /LENGTH=384 /DNA_ID=CAMNT_0015348551 /DNA_START=17 /DNA_END=1168 /DNA_ORIENTATION=-
MDLEKLVESWKASTECNIGMSASCLRAAELSSHKTTGTDLLISLQTNEEQKKAFDLLNRACDLGNPKGCFMAGYFNRFGLSGDDTCHLHEPEFFQKAVKCESDHAEAKKYKALSNRMLADMYIDDPEKQDLAFSLYGDACRQNDAYSCFRRAIILEKKGKENLTDDETSQLLESYMEGCVNGCEELCVKGCDLLAEEVLYKITQMEKNIGEKVSSAGKAVQETVDIWANFFSGSSHPESQDSNSNPTEKNEGETKESYEVWVTTKKGKEAVKELRKDLNDFLENELHRDFAKESKEAANRMRKQMDSFKDDFEQWLSKEKDGTSDAARDLAKESKEAANRMRKQMDSFKGDFEQWLSKERDVTSDAVKEMRDRVSAFHRDVETW